MNHKNEWKQLVDIGQAEGLTDDQIVFMISLRELEDGDTGNEFNILAVQNTSLEVQATFLAMSLKQENKQYQKYLLSFGSGTPISFEEFFLGKDRLDMLLLTMEQVKKELCYGSDSID